MLEGLSPNQLIQGGAVGLLALIVVFLTISVSRGWIVPRSTMEKLYEAQEARVSKAEEREKVWQDAATKWQETAHVLSGQLDQTLEQGRTMIALLNSIAATTRQRGGR